MCPVFVEPTLVFCALCFIAVRVGVAWIFWVYETHSLTKAPTLCGPRKHLAWSLTPYYGVGVLSVPGKGAEVAAGLSFEVQTVSLTTSLCLFAACVTTLRFSTKRLVFLYPHPALLYAADVVSRFHRVHQLIPR